VYLLSKYLNAKFGG